MPDAKPKPKSGGSIMSKKIMGLPAPVVLIGAAIIVFIVYQRVKANSATSGVSASSTATAPDPNAVDPNTGLTYGSEEQAGLGQVAGPPSGNGTGTGGVGSGLSVSDLEGLLSSLQGLGATNYYYGSSAAPTPTNVTGAGNGTGSANVASQTDTGALSSVPAQSGLFSPASVGSPQTTNTGATFPTVAFTPSTPTGPGTSVSTTPYPILPNIQQAFYQQTGEFILPEHVSGSAQLPPVSGLPKSSSTPVAGTTSNVNAVSRSKTLH